MRAHNTIAERRFALGDHAEDGKSQVNTIMKRNRKLERTEKNVAGVGLLHLHRINFGSCDDRLRDGSSR